VTGREARGRESSDSARDPRIDQSVGLSDADFAAARDYLRATAGLVFDDSRRAGLSSMINERLAATGSGDLGDYLGRLASRVGAAERQVLLDLVTVQETSFFRNGPQMEALRRHVLPELLRAAAATSRPLRIWSAGCSTGEEPYTLAMLALAAVAATPGTAKVPIKVLGTDISAAALATAAKATYRGRSLALLDRAQRQRWFDEAGGARVTVREEVRRLVELKLHNLVTGNVPASPGTLDLLVCRNVTIYFGRETTRALMARFHEALIGGGYLVLGHSETLWQLSDAFTLLPFGDAFAYRKDPAPQARRRSGPALIPVARLLPGHRRQPALPAPAATADPARDLAAARAALSRGHYAEAASLAARSTAMDPLSAPAWTVEGHALSTLGQDAEALVALRKAVYLDPAAGDAHFLLAGALARLGDPRAAGRSYRAAAATLPGLPPDVLDGLLDGRDVRDLAAMCLRLADGAVSPASADPVSRTSRGGS